MKVAKSAMAPPLAMTHFEWVPGRQNTPSFLPDCASAPSTWVSSPRITSGRSGARRAMPGRMTVRRGVSGTSIARCGMSDGLAGRSRQSASIQPVRAPAMPQMTAGRPAGAPSAERCDSSISPKRPAASFMPSLLRRLPNIVPSDSTHQRQKEEVPQSTSAAVITAPARPAAPMPLVSCVSSSPRCTARHWPGKGNSPQLGRSSRRLAMTCA